MKQATGSTTMRKWSKDMNRVFYQIKFIENDGSLYYSTRLFKRHVDAFEFAHAATHLGYYKGYSILNLELVDA